MRNDIFLRESAWRYILIMGITELPINAFELAARSDYIVITFRKYSELTGKTIQEIIEKYDDEGFVFWSNKRKSYVICFNDDFPSNVVRWTVMHEISHIVLGHVTQDSPSITRTRKINNPFFEEEADGFARRVLCPSIVLHDCAAFSAYEIMILCGISQTAARYRSAYISQLEKRNKWRTDPLEIKVERQFQPFINSFLSAKHDTEFSVELAA